MRDGDRRPPWGPICGGRGPPVARSRQSRGRIPRLHPRPRCRRPNYDRRRHRPDRAHRLPGRSGPRPLPANPLPERMDFAGALRFEGVVNNAPVERQGPMFTAKRDRTVMLKLSNPTSENSYIHLHGHSFRLLDTLDDGWKPFWLDTLPLAPQTDARIAFVADNPGRGLIEGLRTKNGTEA